MVNKINTEAHLKSTEHNNPFKNHLVMIKNAQQQYAIQGGVYFLAKVYTVVL